MARRIDISKFIKQAEDAVNRRNYDLAIYNYIQALTMQPDNLSAREKLRLVQSRAATEKGSSSSIKMLIPFIKAKIQATMKKYEQAILTCEAAITKNPSHTGPMTLLADCAKKLNTSEMIALAAWQRQEIADKVDPEDTRNLWALEEVYEELEQPEKAIECLEKIKEIDPEDGEVDPRMKQLEADKMNAIFAKSKTSTDIVKDDEERQQFERDPSKLRDDKTRMDFINYFKAHDLVERPDDHRVYLQLADVYFNLDDWEVGYAEAKKYFAIAHEKNPTDNTVLDRQGDLELKKMRIELQKLADNYKESEKDENLRKEYLTARKDLLKWETAEYERRVKAQPLKMDFHNRLGELYFQAKRYDDAISELQQASKTPQFRIKALTTLGRCFHSLDQHEMAIEQFERARQGQEIFKKIVDPLYYQALTHEAMGDLESTKKALKIITDIYQTDINFRDVKKKLPELQKKVKEMNAQ